MPGRYSGGGEGGGGVLSFELIGALTICKNDICNDQKFFTFFYPKFKHTRLLCKMCLLVIILNSFLSLTGQN